MRILNLRLKNLNSLAGEWRIDFTDPAIAPDGLLLISGPTGAGKSTILDALCLALYGRTPRLRNISRSENEIMSRRTGDCLAEVVFAVPAGIYACSWRQNRAYGRPDGTLQAPRQELIDVRAGKPLETKGRNVKDLVEQLTGMDFDQFTRSMLLAQGGFEAFLQASPDERAPLLEQITGTEIYSRISMQVHACWTAEKARRDSLREALGALHVLEEGEEQALLARQAVLEGEIRESMAAMDALRGALAWLEQMERLERDLAALEAERLEWEARRSVFAPEQSRLELALRALELEGSFAALQGLREAQEQDLRALAEKKAVLPLWEARLREAALSAEQAA
ncbi:MAG: AAA family ATPase, partial [Desulfovibrionaceae bacterium]|nr:AAA family ATPase [Desulfovibrionaceae bacterium]